MPTRCKPVISRISRRCRRWDDCSSSIPRCRHLDGRVAQAATIPAHAYGPPNGLAVQLGGPDGSRPGLRAAPSLRYRHNIPPFTEHRHDEDVDESIDQGPAGGYNWDGRAANVHCAVGTGPAVGARDGERHGRRTAAAPAQRAVCGALPGGLRRSGAGACRDGPAVGHPGTGELSAGRCRVPSLQQQVRRGVARAGHIERCRAARPGAVH